MTPAETTTFLKDLAGSFPKSKSHTTMTDEQLRVWREELADVDVAVARRALRVLRRTVEYLPTFLEFHRAAGEVVREREGPAARRAPCRTCGGDGWVPHGSLECPPDERGRRCAVCASGTYTEVVACPDCDRIGEAHRQRVPAA